MNNTENDVTLRDHFAMAALTGLLADEYWQNNISAHSYAKTAYEIADAMSKAREAKP